MAIGERNDGELLAQARAGNPTAYAEFVRRHERRIFRHLLNLTGSREEARELAQDTFLKAWEALADAEPAEHVQAWLYRIASNLAFDLLRRRKVVRFEPVSDEHEQEHASPEAGPDTRLEARQSIGRLQAALESLAPELREVLLLREVEGLSYEELSQALRVGEGTVKSRLSRARAALTARYERVAP